MRISRGIDFWKQHSEAYDAGRLTQAEYCAQHKLSRKTFARWRTIIKKEAGSALQRVEISQPPKLIRVNAQRSDSPGVSLQGPACARYAGISLRGSNWELRVDVGFDVESLSQVLKALRYY